MRGQTETTQTIANRKFVHEIYYARYLIRDPCDDLPHGNICFMNHPQHIQHLHCIRFNRVKPELHIILISIEMFLYFNITNFTVTCECFQFYWRPYCAYLSFLRICHMRYFYKYHKPLSSLHFLYFVCIMTKISVWHRLSNVVISKRLI